jgi:hypothetical protein
MNDLLAIVRADEDDAALLEEVARLHPRRVTLLLEGTGADWAEGESEDAEKARDRIARLLGAIERRTGASVVGTAGDRTQLEGWRFDGCIDAHEPVAA